MKNLKQAAKEDFKIGVTLITKEGYEFTIKRKYDEGVWETGEKVVFESEARHYRVIM